VSKLIRYRPVFKGKDAEMRPDESGDWTSLACYYSLHDRLVRGEAHVAALQAENERLRKAGDAMENELFRVILMELPGLGKDDINNQHITAWLAAKEVQS